MITKETAESCRRDLERLYGKYNRRSWVHPDPLEFLYAYDALRDREIVGLIAAALAYGRVRQIQRSIAFVLDRMGPSPRRFLMKATRSSLAAALEGFRHRFTTAGDLVSLLLGIRKNLARHGSLKACFLSGLRPGDRTVLPAAARFVERLQPRRRPGRFSLLPHPDRGSACKRLHLYLRWMVREDRVDPGGWKDVDPALLIVPLDTHMFRIGRALCLTRRNQANGRTALEITEGFKAIAPADPVRYDFCLTRLGIHGIADPRPGPGMTLIKAAVE